DKIRPGRNRLVIQEHQLRTEVPRQLGIQQGSVTVTVLAPVVDEHPTSHQIRASRPPIHLEAPTMPSTHRAHYVTSRTHYIFDPSKELLAALRDGRDLCPKGQCGTTLGRSVNRP